MPTETALVPASTETALVPVLASIEGALVQAHTVPVTLLDVEEYLQALLDSEALVTDEQRVAFKVELYAALKIAVAKRDAVAAFIAHCESQMGFADAEIERLRKRKEVFGKAKDRIEEYVVDFILAMGTDAKGKYRKLEGKTATLSVKRNPPSVELEDEAAVPLEYKDASISARCPADRWADAIEQIKNAVRFIDSGVPVALGSDARQVLDLILDPRNVKHSVRKADVRKAIDGGADVPGADVAMGVYRLEVK